MTRRPRPCARAEGEFKALEGDALEGLTSHVVDPNYIAPYHSTPSAFESSFVDPKHGSRPDDLPPRDEEWVERGAEEDSQRRGDPPWVRDDTPEQDEPRKREYHADEEPDPSVAGIEDPRLVGFLEVRCLDNVFHGSAGRYCGACPAA